MREETKEMLKKVLLSCVPEEMKRVVEDHELENVKIQIQDCQNPTHRAVYQFAAYEDRFVEQTGMSSYKPMYEPEDFVKAVKEYDYLVSVRVA